MQRLFVILSLSLALPLAACNAPDSDSAATPAAAAAAAEAGDMTAASLVQKHLEASGGEARLRSAKTMMFTAKGVEGDLEKLTVYAERPDHFRKEAVKSGKRLVRAFDGKAAFTIDGDDKVSSLEEETCKKMANHSPFDDALVDYQEKGHQVELVGAADVRGTKALELKVTMKHGSVEHRFYDASTYLEIKRVSLWEHEGKKGESVSYFADYRPVNGIQLNHVIESEGEDGKKMRLLIEDAWFDKPLDPALFQKPGA